MSPLDLNLLRALDILLQEASVARAARRLVLSPSAMSRTLGRLRDVTGDQLLVRAGRGLVPTVRALEMREDVRTLVHDAEMLLRPAQGLNLARLERRFVLRTSDGFAETFGPGLVAKVREEAPGVQLRFVRKLDKDSGGLRDASVDLETGVVADSLGPEIRTQALFTDRYVCAVRNDHPIAQGVVSLEDYVTWSHVIAWRQGDATGQVDLLLGGLGLERDIMTTADGFSAALALARGSDLIATVPERHTAALRHGMHTFAVPLPVIEFTVSLLWHPRMDGDPAHRWLRDVARAACTTSFSQTIDAGSSQPSHDDP